jgi:SAM-dependent methyltransferase
MDLLGKAIAEYYSSGSGQTLKSHCSLGPEETMPVAYFFREFDQMPELEQKALACCRGSVLDIGCGAGSHSLYLQNQGLDPVGLDRSPLATEVASKRGVKNIVCRDIMDYRDRTFDTLLMLMNGIGLAGTLDGLRSLLKHLAGLLNPDGQILLDSSDLIYMYEKDEDGGVWVPSDTEYYGEVTYRWELGSLQGPPFPWLFVDFRTLSREAAIFGFRTKLLATGPHFDYLACLSL